MINFSQWFDPNNSDHLKAYDYLRKHGYFPEGFIPDQVEMDPTWNYLIHHKMATRWLEYKRELEGW